MIEEISRFYKDVVAPLEIVVDPQGMTTTILPLSRMNFCTGSSVAILLLVQKVAFSIFFLVVSIFTCFKYQHTRASLLQNVQEIPTYLGAIPFGLIGIVIPQTLNERILHIPANGLTIHTSSRDSIIRI